MRLSRDNLAFLGIVVVITTTYFLVVFRAQRRREAEIRAQVRERQKQIRCDALTVSRIAPMVREMQALKRRFCGDWHRRLPRRKELAGFLREICSYLAEENLCNQTIRPGTPSRGSLYNRLPITLDFEGNFPGLMGFLRRIDSMTRLTRVEQLEIRPGTQPGRLSIRLGMNIYFTEQ